LPVSRITASVRSRESSFFITIEPSLVMTKGCPEAAFCAEACCLVSVGT
jgi:hypothetical protein